MMTPSPSVMLKTAIGKQLYRSRVARSAVVPERSLRSSGPPWAKARDDFGRQIDVMTYGLVVCRETERETKDAFQEVLYDGHGVPRATSSRSPCPGPAGPSITPVRCPNASSPAGAATRWSGRQSRSSRE